MPAKFSALRFFKTLVKYLALFWLVVAAVLMCIYLYLISQSTKQGDITWQSCYRPAYLSWFVLPPSIQLQCATISVPVDYSKPHGKSFIIPLTRLPSKNPNAIGELLLLNGGPGGHSLDMTLLLSDSFGRTVKDNFHIIGYAPRGVAPSSPALDCGGADSTDSKAYYESCVKHIGADILPFISSKDVIKDLDVIRAKIGSETWSMVGYSYGTKLVTKYAEHYPTRLRAGVADGVVDTSEALMSITANQYKNAQLAFDEFIKTCTSPCIFDTNKDPNTAFIEKLSDISAKNLTDKNGDKIDSQSILKIFEEHLNDSLYWSDMMTMLEELDKGKTTTYNTQKLISELEAKGFSEDALNLVNCADSAPKLSKDEYIQQAKIVDAQAHYNDIEPKSNEDYLDTCYYWQWQATDDLTENLVTKATPDLLFVAQQYDFATPLSNAISMAQRFDDTLIYTPYHGHTVSLSSTNACVDEHVVSYLINPTITFGSKKILCK